MKVKPSRNAQFLLRDGILYRAFHYSTNEIVHQIVVPLCYRDKLSSLAHDTLCGGHMGNRKSRNRILQKVIGLAFSRMLPNFADHAHNVIRVRQKVDLLEKL